MKNYLITYRFPEFPKEIYHIVWHGIDNWDALRRFVKHCRDTSCPVHTLGNREIPDFLVTKKLDEIVDYFNEKDRVCGGRI